MTDNVELKERIPELEVEDREWIPLGMGSDREFSRAGIDQIARLARLMYLKNPLIQRGVDITSDYVFGRRVTINAGHEEINKVIQSFIDDEQNQTEFTSHVMRVQRDRELQIDGNIFLVLIPHPKTGHVRVQSIPAIEITNKILDSKNKSRTLYYERKYVAITFDLDTGKEESKETTRYYRDYRNRNDDRTNIGDFEIDPDVFIYHVTYNKFTDWKFGISEIYAALDWAKAYTKFMENWSTIVAAYARFAFKVTTSGGKAGVAAAKAKLASTQTGIAGETNPVPVTGSTAIMSDSFDMAPIKTAGATTSADDARRLMLMVCATFGFPETFFGDVSVGTLATARSLDRPTELMLTNRQAFWIDVYHDILMFVLHYATTSPAGVLRSVLQTKINEYQEETLSENDSRVNLDIVFPTIIEADPKAEIEAIIMGSTFDGKTPSVIPDQKLLARLVLTVLRVDNIDDVLEELYPGDGPHLPPEPGPIDPMLPDNKLDKLAAAVESFRETIAKLHESVTGESHEN